MVPPLLLLAHTLTPEVPTCCFAAMAAMAAMALEADPPLLVLIHQPRRRRVFSEVCMAPILSSAGQACGVGILGSPSGAPARSPPSNRFTRARRGAFSEVRHGGPQQRVRVRPHNLYCLLPRELAHVAQPHQRLEAERGAYSP